MLKYIFPLFVLFLTACSDTPTSDETTQEQKIIKSFPSEGEMDERVTEIDALTDASDLLASSLNYSKSDGTSILVLGHLNRDNELLKIEERFSDGNGKSNGTRFYYLYKGKAFVTHELIDQMENNTAVFIDRVTYYDEKGKVLKTKERSASFEEDVYKLAYKAAPIQGVSVDRAMRALNSEKEFTTTFQGLIYENGMTYLIVGENTKNDGYTSALRCDFKDPLIIQLSNLPDNYIGEKLKVSFQVEEDRGYRFQLYTGGDFAQ
ncbi:MAG: hypothetical protein IT221_12690 [Fluviicola sp.]|nr:hypothetical protein [Fluviicola sp.]